MSNHKTPVGKFFIRLCACYRIMFRKDVHWALIKIDKQNLMKLLQDKDFDVGVLYHGIREYVMYKMIKEIANGKTDIDMILDKAKFSAKAEERSSSN